MKVLAIAREDINMSGEKIACGEEVFLYKNSDDTYTFYNEYGVSFRVLSNWFEFKNKKEMWIKLEDGITEVQEIKNLGVWTRIKGAGVKRLLSKKELENKYGDKHPTFEEVVEYNYDQCFIPGATIKDGKIVKREEMTVSGNNNIETEIKWQEPHYEHTVKPKLDNETMQKIANLRELLHEIAAENELNMLSKIIELCS